MLKVLISSHAYVVALNQQKLEALAKLKEIKLSLLVPRGWRAALRLINLEKSSDRNYLISSANIFFSGKNDRFFYNPFILLRFFLKEKPALVHIEEEPWSLACLELNLLGKLIRAKTVFFTWENVRRGQKIWYKTVEWINLRLANSAIAGNQEAKERLGQKGFRKPILVLPQFGVDLETFKKTEQKGLATKVGLKDFVIGYFGRLEEQKGINDLISSFKRLDFPAQLLIIGSGPLKELIEEESRKDKRIIYVSSLAHSEIPKYFNLLDVYVLPSKTTSVWKEQFGHVLIEAMASEVPVIGSDSGAIPEVIGGSGLIFKEGHIEDLVDKLRAVYKNKSLRESLSQKGLQRVKTHFTHSQIADQTLKFYQQMSLY